MPIQVIRRCRFSIAAMLAAIFVFAVICGVWSGWSRSKIILVRSSHVDDVVRDRYFGILSHDDGIWIIRNVVVIEGKFSLDTSLSASLFVIRNGHTTELGGWTVGRTRNFVGAPSWEQLRLTIALGTRRYKDGCIVHLGCYGHSHGSGGSGQMPIDEVISAFSESMQGPLTPSREYVIYAEGDAAMILDRWMTIEEFAMRNEGNYLVVTANLSAN